MNCPNCQLPVNVGGGSIVLDSRPARDDSTRRRRQCSGCGHRFTTYEQIGFDVIRGRPRLVEPFGVSNLMVSVTDGYFVK